MKVLLVTTWNSACGIAEHSAYLKAAVEAADQGIELVPAPAYLDPQHCLLTLDAVSNQGDLLHLNYQASLHSRWAPGWMARVQALGRKVIVTYHDTGVPNSDQCKAICAHADACIIHEPADDLPGARYWRMGVPAAEPPYLFGPREDPPFEPAWKPTALTSSTGFKAWADQPVLGTIGFPFPWKHYDELARITAQVGWALLLIAPTASPAQIAAWRAINPDCTVYPEFVPRRKAISLLAGCDATAFAYVCHNTGQSAAILQGIAARKPVLAFHTCRQFRALLEDPLGARTIYWNETFEQIGIRLRSLPLGRVDAGTVALAEQESWAKVGAKYAALYREVAGG